MLLYMWIKIVFCILILLKGGDLICDKYSSHGLLYSAVVVPRINGNLSGQLQEAQQICDIWTSPVQRCLHGWGGGGGSASDCDPQPQNKVVAELFFFTQNVHFVCHAPCWKHPLFLSQRNFPEVLEC